MLRYLCCYECTDYFLDSEDEQGYIYDIQTETFINPIVKIVPKNSDTYSDEEFADDDTESTDEVKVDIIENYID
jgi:hypothetical protein